MRLIILCAAVCLLQTTVQSQTKVRGYVFEDQNGNGRKEKKERGVPGVSVSNGIDVALTDKDGLYELPVGDDNIIFVSKPSGFKVPLNERTSLYFITFTNRMDTRHHTNTKALPRQDHFQKW